MSVSALFSSVYVVPEFQFPAPRFLFKGSTLSLAVKHLHLQRLKSTLPIQHQSRIKMSKRHVPDHPETIHPKTKRAKEIDSHIPYEELTTLLHQQEDSKDTRRVLHWFRSKDLRIHGNRALHAASSFAQEFNAPLLCAYLNCPAEFRWHGTSPARTDFICENLSLMQSELNELDIPLIFLQAGERSDIVPSIVNFIRENDISHVLRQLRIRSR